MKLRRKLLIAVAALTILVIGALALIHTRAVQRQIISTVVDSIEEQTGWRLEIEEPMFRLWPARFIAEGVVVSVGGQPVATVERVEARWGWLGISSSPRRIEAIAIDGIAVDLRDPPPLPTVETGSDEAAVDPWRVVEIGRFTITDGGGAAAVADLLGEIEGVRVEAGMIDGSASVSLQAAGGAVERFERQWRFAGVSLRLTADEDGIVIDELEIEGDDLSLRAEAEMSLDEGGPVRAAFRLRTDLERALGFWDPNLVSGLAPAGVLDIEAEVGLTAENGLVVTAVHHGGRLFVAGYGLDELEVGYSGGIPEIHIAGADWGQATITVDDHGLATIGGQLRRAPVERVLAFAVPMVAAAVPGPISLTGDIDGTVSYPFTLDTLSGRVDLLVETSRGRARVRAEGLRDEWVVDEAVIDLAGMKVTGRGELRSGGVVESEIDLEIPDVAGLATLAESWRLDIGDFDIGELAIAGGPLTGHATLTGSIEAPRFDAELEWDAPAVMGHEFETMTVRGHGDLATVDFSAKVIAGDGAEVAAEGTADLATMGVEGIWELELDNVIRLAGFVEGTGAEFAGLSGSLSGGGGFAYGGDSWALDGRIHVFDAGYGEWRSDEIEAVFDLSPDGLDLPKLTAGVLGGTVIGSAVVGLDGYDAPISLNLEASNLDLGLAPADLSIVGAGIADLTMEIEGTLARPTGTVEVQWRPRDPVSTIPPVVMAGALDDGVLTIVTEEVEVEAGALVVNADLPLGLLPRPSWLWPEAPQRAVEFSARVKHMSSDAIADAMGFERPPVSASGDLELEGSWHPADREATRVLAELNGLRLRYVGGELTAEQPLILSLSGDRVQLAPAVLNGPQTHIEAEGGGDLRTGTFDGSLEAVLSPRIARLIPFPFQMYEPIRVSARIGGTRERQKIDVNIDHPGGALVMRDPALEVRDLTLSAEVVDGMLWINDGSAEVNQGRVEIGGGWDLESGQGVVAEIDNVVVFVGGILSQWSGAVAIEPQTGSIAKIVGELNLVAGLWDQNVSLGSALFGSETLDYATDDPLFEIDLDLDVRGRGTVRVDNNFGRFDARWDVLRVRGTAARPRINGEITIAPGGRFSLAGQRVTVRRGNLVFTGDPDTDPIIEIVPESDFGVFGVEEGQLNTTSLATQSLVGGLAGALGFENETLQPAEISVETERDTAEHVMLGQRISHNVALFFASSATDVQDRSTTLQLWNLPGLKGLAVQVYEKTLDEDFGANLFQRFRWGGSSLYEDRPTIRKIRLEGDWPLRKSRLKKVPGFRRGQPYDPFLLFVAKVRMEAELAGAGYQEAQVTTEAVEANNAWTMIFHCDPGPRQVVIFEGDEPNGRVRREVTAAYHPPPLEGYGFRNMTKILGRHFDAEGYPDAEVVVERREDLVVAEIRRGGETELTGPILAGVPEPVVETVRRRLGKPNELAFLAADEERAAGVIQKILADQGYQKAEVRSVSTVAVGGKKTEVRADVELGPPTVVSELVIGGSDPLGLTGADDFPLEAGSFVNRLSVELAASRLRAGYDAAGYSDATVRGTLTEGPENWWRVTVEIEPGLRRTVEAVQINGLKHTSRRAIASGVTVKPGEILRNSDLDETATRVANFSPIERVDVRVVPEGTSGAKIELDVIEKPRWTTEVGGGWSSERGAQARFGLRDDNLIGRGFGLNLRGRWDQTEWLGFIVASLPPLPGKRMSFTSTIGYSSGDAPENPENILQDESSWSIDATRWLGRGNLAVGTAGEQITGYYRFTRTKTSEKDPCYLDPFCFDFRTTNDTGLLGARYVRDKFDYPFDPRSGYGLFVDVAYSGDLLGSDFDYWTSLGSGSVALSVLGSSTWIQALRIGAAEPLNGTNLHPTARFFAGGQGSVRGFDRNTVGPIFLGDPIGGGALFILNEEIRIPVWGGLRAAVFSDIGQVWHSWRDADFRMSVGAGVGIRWATPIGPVWADIAWPLVNTGISSTKPKFYIGIGRPF